MPAAGFYGGVQENDGFSALFTTKSANQPLVIVTLDELKTAVQPVQRGGRVELRPANSPIYDRLTQSGIGFDEIAKAVTKLASSVAAFQRSGQGGGAHASMEDWRQNYRSRQKKDAPEPVRIGRATHQTTLLSLRYRDDEQRQSFRRPHRF